jgi:hypothetical protein
MENLFTQLETLTELFLLKGLSYERMWEDYEQAEIDDVGSERMLLMRTALLNLHDSREVLLTRINSVKNKIILEASRQHEICILDFASVRQIEFFSGR